MNQTTMIVIAVIVVIALLLLLFLVRGRKQHVSLSDVASPPPPPAQRAPRPAPENGGATKKAAAGDEAAATSAGTEVPPASGEPQVGTGDQLTLLKGLGPKAAAKLNELGISRFDQIAAWNDADVAATDARMGTFKGRIVRDQWVEQARLLAQGDREAFEAKFGKIGG